MGVYDQLAHYFGAQIWSDDLPLLSPQQSSEDLI
jgi:hypothetical protein